MRNEWIKFLIIVYFLLITPFLSNSQSSNECYYIKGVNVIGNEKTEKSIIIRELPFSEKTYLFKDLVEKYITESKVNLLNTSLFHDVSIDKEICDTTVSINIRVKERWYTWFWPLIEHPDRNMNVWWENKDVTRLSAGIHFQQENFRGRREEVNIKILAGYRNYVNMNYEVPYFNRKKTWGIIISTLLSSQKEISYKTIENSQRFFYYHEPLLKIGEVKIAAIHRPGIHFSHSFYIQYLDLKFHDTLQLLNRDYYGKVNNPSFIGLSYLLKIDYRDKRAYSQNGFYMESELSLLSEPKTGYNQSSNRSSLRGYYSLAKRFIIAAELTSKFTLPLNKPYYLQNALGYDRSYIRGYEYLVIEAPHYFIGKYNFRYRVFQEKFLEIPFVRSKKFNKIPISFFAGPHFDMGIAWPQLEVNSNTLQNKFLKGYGIGIDVVTYYDKVFRIEYSFTNQKTSGLFIHFMAAI